jgi:hypothetical protein
LIFLPGFVWPTMYSLASSGIQPPAPSSAPS